MIVVDASALLEVLLRTSRGADIESLLLGPGQSLNSPHLLDVEVVQVIRRFARVREIDLLRAQAALDDLVEFPIRRHSHTFLVPRAWALRDNFSAYDAVYVALAEVLDATLVTHDRRLASVARQHVPVELV